MSATLVGSLNAGLLCPEIMLSIGFAAPQLQASLTAALAIQASIGVTPPTLAVQLEAMLTVITEIQAALSSSASRRPIVWFLRWNTPRSINKAAAVVTAKTTQTCMGVPSMGLLAPTSGARKRAPV